MVRLVELENLVVGVQERGQDVVAVFYDPFVRGGTHCRNVNRRVGLLYGLRDDVDFPDLVKLAVVFERARPGFQDDFQFFLKPFAAFLEVDSPVVKFLSLITAPHAEEEPPFRHDINGGEVFRDNDGIVEGQHDNRGADLNAFGNGRRVRGHGMDGRCDRIVVGPRRLMVEVVFRQPDGVPARFVHEFELFERFVINLHVVLAGRGFQQIELAEFHWESPEVSRQ